MLPELLPSLTALWLGILTSFSPCPLATNLAAVGWLAGAGATPARTVGAGVLYGLGRALSYALLGALLTASLLSAVGTARFLQHDLNRVLGPLLIVAGMILLDLLPLRLPGFDLESKGRRIALHGKGLGAFLLGALFALSFCPVSAALFFGSLLPLATAESSPWFLPAVYGVGTAIPVLALAALLAFSAQRVGKIFRKVELVERFVRRVTGILFVGAGLYLSWAYVLKPVLIG
jgi:cytochrome c biogenesis protein CcdA